MLRLSWMNPALPANRRRVEAVVTPRCVECHRPLVGFRLELRGKLYCREQCADVAAIRKLRECR